MRCRCNRVVKPSDESRPGSGVGFVTPTKIRKMRAKDLQRHSLLLTSSTIENLTVFTKVGQVSESFWASSEWEEIDQGSSAGRTPSCPWIMDR